MSARVLVWCESLVGAGHLRAVSHLLRALAHEGASVALASGTLQGDARDFDYGGAEIIALPGMVRHPTQRSFVLVSERTERRARLIDACVRMRPTAVVTESWPLSRTHLDEEVTALVDTGRAQGARIYSLARDVAYLPDDSSPEEVSTPGSRVLDEAFDAVLVRGDGAIALEESWPAIRRSRVPVHYCGYFAPAPIERPHGSGEVLVAAGAGAPPGTLEWMHAALDARGSSSLRDAPWSLFVPAPLPEAAYRGLVAHGHAAGVSVQRNDATFISRLVGAAAAIVQAGYNNVVEVLAAGVPAVLIPREDAREQAFRLERFAAYRVLGPPTRVLACAQNDSSALASALDLAVRGAAPAATIALDGAPRAARWIATGVFAAS